MIRPATWLAASLMAVTLLGCSESDERPTSDDPTAAVSAPPSATTETQSSAASQPEPAGDAEHGKKLVAEFECQRCHGGIDDVKPIADTSHCFNCHQNVMDGKFAQKADNARWMKNVAHLTHAPTLSAMESRFRYDWLVRFLVEPHDLRPNLQPTMPRLALSREQARDIASFLMGNASERPAAVKLDGADAAAGRKLMEDKACGSCHRMTGVAALPGAENRELETRPAVMLAPDLRYARDRLDATTVVAWLLDPLKVKKGTLMPQTPMTPAEAKNIAAYILTTELAPLPEQTIPELPPVLDRPVSYEEVAGRVLDKTCRHCHGDPDVALGDGGPGNTGGFGFKPRGLNLSRYEYVMAGWIDDAGERQSVFKKTKGGVPRLVAAMMARHAEVAGKPDEEVRGMPLGLPPIAIEDIQLVLTWIAQGRPR